MGLDNQNKKEISNMLALKVNKKLLQQNMIAETGKVIILKDIHNCNVSAGVDARADKSKDLYRKL